MSGLCMWLCGPRPIDKNIWRCGSLIRFNCGAGPFLTEDFGCGCGLLELQATSSLSVNSLGVRWPMFKLKIHSETEESASVEAFNGSTIGK